MKLKNNIGLILLSIVCFGCLFSDGFRVPIKLSYSSSFGYDSNVFRLSDLERNQKYDQDIVIINSDTFDAPYINSRLGTKYAPKIFKKFKTEFNFSFSGNSYITIPDKSFLVINSGFGIKFAPYRWIKISHRYLPQYYLRNFRDKDYSIHDYYQTEFSSEGFVISFSNRIYKKNWFRIKYSRTNLYYNDNFTEFDIEKNSFEAKLYCKILEFDSNLSYMISIGNNPSYDQGYNSTIYDRSYTEHAYGVYAKKRIKKSNFINVVGLSSIIKNRIFLDRSEVDVFDPLHNGRQDIEYNFSIWVGNKINKKLSHEFKLKHRSKDVFSKYKINYYNGTGDVEEILVSDLREYRKFEVVYKITYNINLNVFR